MMKIRLSHSLGKVLHVAITVALLQWNCTAPDKVIILCRTACVSNKKFQIGIRQNDNGGANMLWMTIEY